MKEDCDSNHVTLAGEDTEKRYSFKCKKCNTSYTNKKDLIFHNNTDHPKTFCCNKYDFEGGKLSDIDEHILKCHNPSRQYKCSQCEIIFLSEHGQKMHDKMHRLNWNVKFCHYYNNSQVCPHEVFGCRFIQSDAKICRFGKNCTKCYASLNIPSTQLQD